jgi:hypothetical protein
MSRYDLFSPFLGRQYESRQERAASTWSKKSVDVKSQIERDRAALDRQLLARDRGRALLERLRAKWYFRRGTIREYFWPKGRFRC